MPKLLGIRAATLGRDARKDAENHLVRLATSRAPSLT